MIEDANFNLLVDTINIVDNFKIDILRLDKIHPIISGNKALKLHYFIQDAIQKKYKYIASFGGGHSNHLVALAYYCKITAINSVGFINGDYSKNLNPTLLDCIKYGMKLVALSHTEYKQIKKNNFPHNANFNHCYFIPEGGYGTLGVQGIYDLNKYNLLEKYSHIIIAVGSGTSIAGLINVTDKKL